MILSTSRAREMYEAGERWTDHTARQALPILLWCAKKRRTITYGQLAAEIERRTKEKQQFNKQKYGGAAGKIANVLVELSNEWEEDVPPINAILVRADTNLPGNGADGFLDDYLTATARQEMDDENRDAMAELVIQEVFEYPRWDEVAAQLGIGLPLQRVTVVEEEDLQPVPLPAPRPVRGDGGEGQEHRRLKEWIARHPDLFRNFGTYPQGKIEQLLQSGDRVDVLFESGHNLLAVEVKAANASDDDLRRGIFQCVKYRAVLQAEQFAQGQIPTTRALLAVQRRLPKELDRLARRLRVPVIVVSGN
jgi:hypothetical protein